MLFLLFKHWSAFTVRNNKKKRHYSEVSRRMNKSNKMKRNKKKSTLIQHKRRLNNVCVYYYVIKYAHTLWCVWHIHIAQDEHAWITVRDKLREFFFLFFFFFLDTLVALMRFKWISQIQISSHSIHTRIPITFFFFSPHI